MKKIVAFLLALSMVLAMACKLILNLSVCKD